jgi:type VI protein secretion system component Hcp
MANDWCDGFLQLVKDGQPVEGECGDGGFVGAIEFQSFRFGDSGGFTDSDSGFYAEQNAGNRGSSALSRAQDANPFGGVASLFGEEEQGDTGADDLSEKEMKEFEGKDLAEVAACNFQLVKEMDLSSPDLFKAYCSTQDLENREVFDSATVSLRKATGAGRKVFLEYTFNDLLVVGYTLEVGPEGSPKETLNFSFAKLHCEYKPQEKTGELGDVVQGGWDFIERGTH